ncbi:MAG: hypothetical protein K6F58_01695 [Bacteroidales bacterium]|nr:hypothetical protein [Bacteroidales bacterium]
MKKTYLEPLADATAVSVERVIMTSMQGAAGQDVSWESGDDFDHFFNS